MNNKVLIIAPHADDEIIGCGATIAKHVDDGDEVVIVIATNAAIGAPELYTENGIKLVRKEALDAHKLLGVKKTLFLDFPAPALNAFPEYKISTELSSIFNKYTPSYLYIPHPGDIHQDHKAIYRASLVSARPLKGNKIGNIYCYETLSETEWTPMQEKPFVPNHFVDVTNYFHKKIEAMNCYHSQIKNFPYPRSIESFESLAKFRGSIIGVEKAEAFEVERQMII